MEASDSDTKSQYLGANRQHEFQMKLLLCTLFPDFSQGYHEKVPLKTFAQMGFTDSPTCQLWYPTPFRNNGAHKRCSDARLNKPVLSNAES